MHTVYRINKPYPLFWRETLILFMFKNTLGGIFYDYFKIQFIKN
ncbi:MAG: hypothetical protein ACI9TY_000738 [Alphaproteobacteria bacterium]|jgi:hypothetical protein